MALSSRVLNVKGAVVLFGGRAISAQVRPVPVNVVVLFDIAACTVDFDAALGRTVLSPGRVRCLSLVRYRWCSYTDEPCERYAQGELCRSNHLYPYRHRTESTLKMEPRPCGGLYD